MNSSSEPFIPMLHFASIGGGPHPQIFAAPQRYIQGEGVLDRIGHYLAPLGLHSAGLLLSPRCEKAEGQRIISSLQSAGSQPVISHFNGECSFDEIGGHVETFSAAGKLDYLIAVGGGKAVDTGKCVAFRLGIPLVVVPTLASNDAPCSAVSVIYTPSGEDEAAEFFPQNPIMVIVDTGVIANAAERYLVSGMGDAMATFYEARVCRECSHALTAAGGRPTLAGAALGEICAHTLYADGFAAAQACANSTVNDALERIVEANTLLSGIGFESGGLAAAHAVAQGCTAVASVRDNYLHGEMVAIGTLAQLALEDKMDEAARVADFFASVGLPTHLDQIGLRAQQAQELAAIVAATLEFPFLPNMPFEVTGADVHAALLKAHSLGEQVSANSGDSAWRKLHSR
jgi:glycerol dehydrogenase